jgi:asparagine synthase (glutamine-hydrolysing)
LLRSQPRLNQQRVFDFLRWGSYNDLPETIYEDVLHLLPGHWIRLSLTEHDQSQPIRWCWPGIEERTDLSFDQAAEEFRELFLNSIRLHLRSDVPIGACLSGGLDSSAIVCAMRYLEPDMPINTFTYVARGTSVDEEVWADIVNDHVNAIAHKIFVTPDELADDLEGLIRNQGEPFMSTGIYAQHRVFKMAKEAGVIVTLDGQGADETLAGYAGYPTSRLRSLAEKRQFVKMLHFARSYSKKPAIGAFNALQSTLFGMTPKSFLPIVRRLQDKQNLPPWFNTEAVRSMRLRTQLPEFVDDVPKGRRLVGALRHACFRQGLPALLRHADRSSMHHSIESRVPFLDIQLVKFLLRLPEQYLVSQELLTKRILRAGLRGIVPDVVLDRTDKIGFRTPEKDWLKSIDWTSVIDSKSLETIPFLNATQVRQKLSGFLSGKQSRDSESWRLINFISWLEINQAAC